MARHPTLLYCLHAVYINNVSKGFAVLFSSPKGSRSSLCFPISRQAEIPPFPNHSAMAPPTATDAQPLLSEPPKASLFDPKYTQRVIDTIGPRANPRLREIMVSLIRHMHDFVRETELTLEELLAGLEVVIAAGKMSDGGRNEVLMLCDVLGLEKCVFPSWCF
jgi:Catechol dioxygenase N terminus